MKKYLIIIALFVFFGCKEKSERDNIKNDDRTSSQENKQKCLSDSDIEEIVFSILNTQRIQNHLHPDVKGQLPIKVLENKLISSDLEVISNGYGVIIVDSLNLTDNTFRIAFEEVDCKNLNFNVTYPIEGQIYFSGVVVKLGLEWIANITHAGIAD